MKALFFLIFISFSISTFFYLFFLWLSSDLKETRGKLNHSEVVPKLFSGFFLMYSLIFFLFFGIFSYALAELTIKNVTQHFFSQKVKIENELSDATDSRRELSSQIIEPANTVKKPCSYSWISPIDFGLSSLGLHLSQIKEKEEVIKILHSDNDAICTNKDKNTPLLSHIKFFDSIQGWVTPEAQNVILHILKKPDAYIRVIKEKIYISLFFLLLPLSIFFGGFFSVFFMSLEEKLLFLYQKYQSGDFLSLETLPIDIIQTPFLQYINFFLRPTKLSIVYIEPLNQLSRYQNGRRLVQPTHALIASVLLRNTTHTYSKKKIVKGLYIKPHNKSNFNKYLFWSMVVTSFVFPLFFLTLPLLSLRTLIIPKNIT